MPTMPATADPVWKPLSKEYYVDYSAGLNYNKAYVEPIFKETSIPVLDASPFTSSRIVSATIE